MDSGLEAWGGKARDRKPWVATMGSPWCLPSPMTREPALLYRAPNADETN